MGSEAKRALGQGRPIVIFPEGTRGPVGGKLPYQPGVGALYAQLGLPVVPVALNSGVYWQRPLLDKSPGKVIVEILPAIPAGLDRRQVMPLMERRIEVATARLVEEALGPQQSSAPPSASA
jgi:1-acyl-sn-glycerol-3-phosphate acyltransferase